MMYKKISKNYFLNLNEKMSMFNHIVLIDIFLSWLTYFIPPIIVQAHLRPYLKKTVYTLQLPTYKYLLIYFDINRNYYFFYYYYNIQ